MAQGPDVVVEYVAAEYLWREASAAGSKLETRDQIAAAREYVRAIDAYVATLRAWGRQIPYRLDEVADTLRAAYGEAPKPQDR
jgi:hypothetical protein